MMETNSFLMKKKMKKFQNFSKIHDAIEGFLFFILKQLFL